MDKRYQVFISSTFADLEEERKGVMEAIIELDCFPAGMEMFPASNMEQFDYIKSVIDESDYYVIIVAGRYGSVADDGISYTEKEFDYAKQKGIPILAFVKKDISTLPFDKCEKEPEKREKLEKFRTKVLEGRLAKFWDTSESLKYSLHSSLAREMKMTPRIGWIRADSSSDIKVYKTINALKQENQKLREELERLLQMKNEEKKDSEKVKNEEAERKFNSKFSISIREQDGYENEIQMSIIQLLRKIGYRLLYTFDYDALHDSIIKEFVDEDRESSHVVYADMQQIIMKLLALKLIETNGYELDDEMETTEYGKQVILSMVEF